MTGAEREELSRLKRENRRRRQERGGKRLTRPHWGHGSLDALAKAAAWVRSGDRLGTIRVFEFVRANQAMYSIAMMCRLLEVSTSGY